MIKKPQLRQFLFICMLFAQVSVMSASIKEIKIDPTKMEEGDLAMSDLVESITYIPLETTTDCLMGYVPRVKISKNYIFANCAQSKSAYLFDKNGKFLRKISRVGQGPGEYLAINGLALNEEKNELIIADFGRLLYFDLNGQFIKKAEIEESTNDFIIDFCGDKLLTFIPSGFFTDSLYSVYTVRAMKGKDFAVTQREIPSQPVVITGKHKNEKVAYVNLNPLSCYWYNNKLHVKENTLNDTIYQINERLEFVPQYIVNVGNYAITAAIRGDGERFSDLIYDKVGLIHVNETDNYLLISYKYLGKMVYCYHEKAAGETKRFKSGDKIPNNFDGGVGFVPNRNAQQNKTCYQVINAEDFIKAAAVKKTNLKGAKADIDQMNRIANKLVEDDNPVIAILNFK